MKRHATLLLSTCLLVGCATYQADKVPAAIGMLKIESQECVDGIKTDRFHTAVEFAQCLATTREHFAAAIEFRHPEIVAVYRARVVQIADRLDHGLANADQTAYGLEDADKDFYEGIVQTAQIEESERQRAFAALAATGQAMQQAAAYQQANRPAAPVITTTTCNTWSRTSGQCVSVSN